jgi:alcohol dehydrogenase class IV
MLDELRKIRSFEILDRVFPDPKVDDVMAMVNELQRKPVNMVIGIGGGSAMDSAKAVTAVLSNGGDLNDYLGATATRKLEKRDVKLILIPTTSGTGSEVTKVGVYTSHSGRKYTLGHPLMQADIAVLVTGFVLGLPPALTASTAFDALSHALETLWNRNATPLTDRAAIESAVHILKWMETAYDSSLTGATEGRAEMLEGACMAGTAFTQTGTAAVHALSFILSEEWHVPHGVACAFTLEDVFRLNISDEKTRQKLAQVAKALFGKDDEERLIAALLDRIIALKKKFGLPFTFRDLKIDLDESRIGELFDKSLDDPKMKNNIVPVDKEIIFELVKSKI